AGTAPSERAVARAVRDALAPLGLRLRLRFVPAPVVTALCTSRRSRVAMCPGAVLDTLVGEPEALLGSGFAPGGVANATHLPAPGLAAAIAAAGRFADPDERAAAWAGVNRGLVGQAPGVPWQWDELTLLAARDVRAVANERLGGWDLPASALEEDGR
ncbi:MAG: hypothetical protein M3P39_12460, partial [Actinomycetota bacterium]|nr:hypothetical protein [Actinomycetota bacterium]